MLLLAMKASRRGLGDNFSKSDPTFFATDQCAD